MSRVARSKRTISVCLLLIAIGFGLFAQTYDRPQAQTQGDLDPFVYGRWELSFSAPHPMSHAAVLPNGKVLYWTAVIGPPTESRLWSCVLNNGLCDLDLNSNNDQAVPYNTTDLFCSAHSFLPNGQLFVAGGSAHPGVGTRSTTVFDLNPSPSPSPIASPGPTMTKGRWYPSTVTLGTGETALVSGTHCQADPPTNGCNPLPFNRVPEVVNSGGTTLRLLSTAEEALNEAVWYPWVYLGSDGRVFRAGPLSPSRWLDTAGTGTWGTTTKPHVNASTVPYRDFGSAVTYDVDKVLITGGGQNPPTNTAETIVLTNETGNWTATNNMAHARRHHNLTILADGKVLASGGTSGPGFNNTCLANAVFQAESWNPSTGAWSPMAPLIKRRQYHSVAVLLIDGRVLVGGTTSQPESHKNCGNVDDELQQEIFSPPYLFNSDGSWAIRPTITSAPDTISYGTNFVVGVSSLMIASRVTLVRLSSVTHSTNMNQRFNNLSFNRVVAGLNVSAPANSNIAPPGHYMLFVFNKSGVPSVAKIVKLQ